MTDENEVTAPAEPSPTPETPAILGDGAPTPPNPEPESTQEPRSRLDSIEKAFADIDAEAPTAEAKPEPKTDDQGRLRGPDGKFAPKEPSAELKPEAPKEAEPADKGLISEPPDRFSADAKVAWKDAPEPVQGEIKRAITELESGLAQKDAQLEPLKPFFDMAQQHDVKVHEVMGNYVRMEQLLAKDMRAGLTVLAQNFGISFEQMIAQATGQAPQGQADPRDAQIASLTAELHDLKNMVTGVSDTVSQSQEKDLVQQIETFAADKPAFDYLENDIAALLTQNPGMTLDQAYGAAFENAQKLMAALNPPPNPEPESNPAPSAVPAQPRPQRSVTGAPNAGSDPDTRQPSRTRTEALQRAFSAAGVN